MLYHVFSTSDQLFVNSPCHTLKWQVKQVIKVVMPLCSISRRSKNEIKLCVLRFDKKKKTCNHCDTLGHWVCEEMSRTLNQLSLLLLLLLLEACVSNRHGNNVSHRAKSLYVTQVRSAVRKRWHRWQDKHSIRARVARAMSIPTSPTRVSFHSIKQSTGVWWWSVPVPPAHSPGNTHAARNRVQAELKCRDANAGASCCTDL